MPSLVASLPARRYVCDTANVVSLYGGKDRRELPMYGIGEAAVYLGVPRSALATWVRGQRVRERTRMHGLIKPDRATGLLTFNNMTEAYVLVSLTRRFELPLQRVCSALRFVGGERPLLATPFRTDGRGIFIEQMGKLVDAAHGGQAAIREVVESSLERVDLDDRRLPLRLYPWRREPTEPRIHRARSTTLVRKADRRRKRGAERDDHRSSPGR